MKSEFERHVRDLGLDPVPAPKSRPVCLAFTVSEVCALTKLSRSFIYQLIATGSLPARKCGARTLILFDDLIAFLRNFPSLPASGTRNGGSE